MGPPIDLPADPLINGHTALSAWRDDDLGDLVALCQDPEIARYTRVPSPYTELDGRAYLHQRHELLHTGRAAPLKIAHAGSGETLGSVALMRIEPEHARAEVGYWLGAAHRGRGHATRALRLICAFAFRDLALSRISLLAATVNEASQAVAERSGFTREAVLRSYAQPHPQGERLDMVVYGLLAS